MPGDSNQDEAWSYSGLGLAVIHGARNEPLLTLYDVSQQHHHTRNSTEFANKRVYGCFKDWLLVNDPNIKDKQDLCIINVVTMQKYQLPPMSENEYNDFFRWNIIFLMSGSPVDDVACTVYLVTNYDTIMYCKIGARNFITHQVTSATVSEATVFQGSLYYIRTSYHSLYRAQLEDSSPMRFEKCIKGSKLKDQLIFYESYSHLVGSCDDKLLYVVGRRLDMGVEDMHVFGADLRAKVWERLYNISGAIFLDEFGAFLTPLKPECRLQENRVYYIPFLSEFDEDPDDLSMMAYDLRGECVAMLSPLPFKVYGRTRDQVTHRLRWINR